MKLSRFFLLAGMMLLPQMMTAQRILQPLGRGVVAVNNNGNRKCHIQRLCKWREGGEYFPYLLADHVGQSTRGGGSHGELGQ